jgi:hypothetical protein
MCVYVCVFLWHESCKHQNQHADLSDTAYIRLLRMLVVAGLGATPKYIKHSVTALR